jgi:hypothetical protein
MTLSDMLQALGDGDVIGDDLGMYRVIDDVYGVPILQWRRDFSYIWATTNNLTLRPSLRKCVAPPCIASMQLPLDLCCIDGWLKDNIVCTEKCRDSVCVTYIIEKPAIWETA